MQCLKKLAQVKTPFMCSLTYQGFQIDASRIQHWNFIAYLLSKVLGGHYTQSMKFCLLLVAAALFVEILAACITFITDLLIVKIVLVL